MHVIIGGDMAEGWLVEAARLLDELPQPHKEKKKATILALIDARLAGHSEETVWDRPDTCSRSIYHEKWKKNATFARVLAEVTRLAMSWRDSETLRALKRAAERLALASPTAAIKLIDRLDNADDGIVLRAAFGILDRAGVDTAVKSATPTTNIILRWGEPGEDDDAHHANIA